MKRNVLVAGVVALLLEAIVVVWSLGHGDAGPGSDPAPDTKVMAPPAAMSSPGSFIASRVRSDGTVWVTQWIRSPVPVSRLTISVDDLPHPDARPQASRLQVVTGDGALLVSGLMVGPEPEVVRLEDPVSLLRLTYELKGVVARSGSVTGRALAGVTFLDVGYRPATGPVVVEVTGGRVLNLACTPAGAEVAPRRPCGTPTSVGWSVRLADPHRNDQVSAQLDLG